MSDSVEVDLDMLWSSVQQEAFDRLACLASGALGTESAVLSSFDGTVPVHRGTKGALTPSRDGFAPCVDVFTSEATVALSTSAVGAYLGVPLRLAGAGVVGTLSVIDSAPREWSDEDIDLLDELATCFSARIGAENELRLRERAAAALVNANHELRTPLQAIIGFTEFLKTEQKPDVIAAHARTIQSAAESLLTLVNQTLDIAGHRAEADLLDRPLPEEATDLRAFSETCLNMVAPLAIEKRLALRVDIAADVPDRVQIDAQKVGQALLNLLTNAVKFTDAGEIRLRLERAASHLRFSVVDTGIGIAANKRDLLFQRFSRILADERQTDGSGLGLNISKKLIESLDGHIGFATNDGEGSTFWIEVPLAADATEAPAATAAPVEAFDPPPRPGASILLADDLDLNRKLIADMLGLDGHVVECVADGAAAVAAAGTGHYDLILMDMIMPIMDGMAATRAIRKLPAPHCLVPIVALTAHSFREQLDACLDAGMDATLTKPMSLDALIQAVETWTRKRVEAA